MLRAKHTLYVNEIKKEDETYSAEIIGFLSTSDFRFDETEKNIIGGGFVFDRYRRKVKRRNK